MPDQRERDGHGSDSALRLHGKVAIVTGAARGMGEQHARRFVREGASVVLTDIEIGDGQRVADELGDRALILDHDVASLGAWRKVVEAAEQAFGPVDVLVNNAAVLGPTASVVDLDEEDYLRVCATNQHAHFYGMKAVIPSMQRAGGGSIINISSTAGLAAIRGTPNLAYVASKFASRGMTKQVAVEFGPEGIRANSVHPGYIETAMTAGASPEQWSRITSRLPLRRMGTASEVTSLVLFLASDESSYITGAEYVIDAGLTAQ